MKTRISLVVAVIFLEQFTGLPDVLHIPAKYDTYCPAKMPCDSKNDKHLVCVYHEAHQKQDYCEYVVEHKFTHADAAELLRILNRYRIDVANGRAVGAEQLPKGYGIMRLQWDSELAGLGQYLADLCYTYSYFECATTSKFPKTLPIYFFKQETPPIDKADSIFMNVADVVKRVPALIDGSLRQVTVEKIKNPAELRVPIAESNNRYVSIVQGQATHIGCGHKQFQHDILNDTHLRLTSYLRCYISFRTEPSNPIYNITAPHASSGYSKKCGCPLFHRENEDCLCEEYRPHTHSTPPVYYHTQQKRIRGPTKPTARPDAPARGGAA